MVATIVAAMAMATEEAIIPAVIAAGVAVAAAPVITINRRDRLASALKGDRL